MTATTHQRGRPASRAVVALAIGAALVSAAGLTGCRGDRSGKPPRQFLPDMDDQPRVSPQGSLALFDETDGGRAMRVPPAGIVAFDRHGIDPVRHAEEDWYQRTIQPQRDALLREDSERFHGVVAGVDFRFAWQSGNADPFIHDIPIPVDAEMITRGLNRYDIFCAACHGYAGEGGGENIVETGGPVNRYEQYGGLVGRRWSYAVPSFHDERYQKGVDDPGGRDGYLFYTTMYGVGFESPEDVGKGLRMPGYSHALSADDAWAIVAYIRALQLSRNFPMAELRDDVPAERDARERLRRLRMGGAGTAERPASGADLLATDRGETEGGAQ
ncbi:MAG: hypothetical protein EA423_05405 [Phycisphaerales bacterium]|nr:MAG: hypothetical protein EA423_05405 [Phycisphaerales bacterium]